MTFKCNTKARLKTEFLAVHCSATQATQDIGAAEIDRWHRGRGFQCIGYHFVIRRDGRIEEGRSVEKIGAHVEGFNHNSVGICMVGGITKEGKAENNFTPAQFATLKSLLKTLKTQYPAAVIQGHRDFPDVHKDCPSFDVKGWLKE